MLRYMSMIIEDLAILPNNDILKTFFSKRNKLLQLSQYTICTRWSYPIVIDLFQSTQLKMT